MRFSERNNTCSERVFTRDLLQEDVSRVHAETSRYEICLFRKASQQLWRAREFEPVDSAVAGFQVINNSGRCFTLCDVLISILGATQVCPSTQKEIDADRFNEGVHTGALFSPL